VSRYFLFLKRRSLKRIQVALPPESHHLFLIPPCLSLLPYTGSHLPLTEMQPSDDLALLAAHCLIAASSVSTSPQSHLLSALSLLNFATKKSPKGYQLRILSIRIFKLLGCFGQALEHYNQVGIKALQFDTLSHLILERGEMFGGEMTEGDKEKGKSKANGKKTRKSKVEEKIEDSMQIYESNEKETMSVIGRAFDLGTYSRVSLEQVEGTWCQTGGWIGKASYKSEHDWIVAGGKS